MKKCTKCGLPKKKSDFPHNGFRKSGKEVIGTVCNDCRREYFKDYYRQKYQSKKPAPLKLRVVRSETKKITPCSSTCKCHKDRHAGVKFK